MFLKPFLRGLLCLLPYLVGAQSPFWQRNYSFQNYIDNPKATIAFDSSGFAMAAYSFTPDFTVQAIVFKVDKQGETVWSHQYDSIQYRKIMPTRDSGYILFGQHRLGSKTIQKINKLGVQQWRKTTTNPYNNVTSVIPTNDLGYMVRGYDSGEYLEKLDASGNVLWRNTWQPISSSTGGAIWELSDGNFIFGEASGLTRADPLGNRLWHRPFRDSAVTAYAINIQNNKITLRRAFQRQRQ
ncbi:MAG: hypothetical protein RIS64_3739 [Bacteroidota bacterium]